MIPLPRSLVKVKLPPAASLRFGWTPLQVGMQESPYYVALASMLLCRARRAQAEPVLMDMLERWPYPEELCRAEELEEVLRPCGLQRNRARQIGRFATLWLSDSWDDLRDLPGVGLYVADAVGLFCFGCTELESGDDVLKEFAQLAQQNLREGADSDVHESETEKAR